MSARVFAPWRAVEFTATIAIYDRLDNKVAEVKLPKVVVATRDRANARLIVAAPALLIALEESRKYIQNDRNEMFASCTVGGDITTLDQEDAGYIAEIDAQLARIDAALNAATGDVA